MLPLGSQSSCMSYSVVGLKPESFQVSCQAVFSLNEDRLCATDPNNSSSPGLGGGVSEATWLGQKEPWESGVRAWHRAPGRYLYPGSCS